MNVSMLETTTPESPPSLPSPDRSSLRANFVWAFIGNTTYAACQWGMLIVLAKLGDATMVGEFALALAITAPIYLFAGLNTRGLQASDARREFQFGDYLGLRFITSTLALLMSATLAMGYSGPHRDIILAVALAKAIESIADVYYGYFQLHERLDLVAMSMIVKGILSLTALTIALIAGHGLLAGTIALGLAWLIVLLGFDLRWSTAVARRNNDGPLRPRFDTSMLKRLGWLAFPLGIVMCLGSLNASIPRFFIEGSLGLRELGIFAALSYLIVAGTTVVNALGQAATPRLAQRLHDGDRRGFLGLIAWLMIIGAALGIGGVLVAWLGGRPLLRLLYRPEYAEHDVLFIWLMAAAGLGYVGSLLGYSLTAARCLRGQTVLHIILTLTTVVSCWAWIPKQGFLGAGWALTTVGVVWVAGSLVLIEWQVLRTRSWR